MSQTVVIRNAFVDALAHALYINGVLNKEQKEALAAKTKEALLPGKC